MFLNMVFWPFALKFRMTPINEDKELPKLHKSLFSYDTKFELGAQSITVYGESLTTGVLLAPTSTRRPPLSHTLKLA